MGMLFNEQGQPVEQALTLALGTPRQVAGAWVFGARFKLSMTVDAAIQALQLQDAASLVFSFDPLDVMIQDGSAGWHLNAPRNGSNAGDREYDLVRPVRLHKLTNASWSGAKLYRMDAGQRVGDPTIELNSLGGVISADFTAAQFTVNRVPANSAVGNLGLHVQGRATSPRLKLRMGPPDGSGESLWQWLDCPGEQAQACGTTINAASWASALERALALWRKSGASASTPLVLTLEAWSDAPCTLKLTPNQFEFKGKIQSPLLGKAGALTDEAMRFGGEVHQCQSITLPGSLAKVSAVAVLLGITQADALSAGGLPAASGLGQQGFALQSGNWVGRSWEVCAPRFVAGLAVPWWPLEAASSLTLSLHAEQAGHLSDTPLALASVSSESVGAHWLVFRWAECQLQPGTYWLRLRATDGGGIWLGAPTEDVVHIIKQEAQQAHVHLTAPVQPIVAELASTDIHTPKVRCTLDGQAMSLQPDADAQPEHWVARLDKLSAPLSAGVLTICCDDPVLVSVRDVAVEQAIT